MFESRNVMLGGAQHNVIVLGRGMFHFVEGRIAYGGLGGEWVEVCGVMELIVPMVAKLIYMSSIVY